MSLDWVYLVTARDGSQPGYSEHKDNADAWARELDFRGLGPALVEMTTRANAERIVNSCAQGVDIHDQRSYTMFNG